MDLLFKQLLPVVIMILTYTARGQNTYWKADSSNSIIQFITSGPFGEVDGNLYGLKADIRFDEKLPDSGFFAATIRASSVKTGLGMRDEHLCDEDFFYTARYPVFTFRSSKITKAGSGGFIITGNLTIKNTTHQVTLPFTFERTVNGATFKGMLTLDCYDYSVGSSSRKVKIILQVPVTPLKNTD
ncbi:MAG: YceI family protein [Bacteroidia bacterium]|nr:YceI family protein [Bacteroidia bacterium]